jgi:hypothetical protein
MRELPPDYDGDTPIGGRLVGERYKVKVFKWCNTWWTVPPVGEVFTFGTWAGAMRRASALAGRRYPC